MSERRSLIGLAVVCLLVAVGAVGYGAGKASDVPEVIRAQRFEVVDGEGRTRAALGCQEDGGASLVFTGKDGHLWATLGAARDGTSGLILYDGAGHERAVLGRSAEGESTLLLVGQEGTGSAGLAVGADSLPSLELDGEGGKGRAVLTWPRKSGHIVMQPWPWTAARTRPGHGTPAMSAAAADCRRLRCTRTPSCVSVRAGASGHAGPARP